MATLRRNAKSAQDWTINDLAAYNISISRQDTTTFFGQATLPPPPHHSDLLNTSTVAEMEDSYQVIQYMNLVMQSAPGEDSAVVDFTVQLLRVMGYGDRRLGTVIRSRKDIPLIICGEWMDFKTDVCIMTSEGNYYSRYLLLVREDKRHLKEHLKLADPVPQLIAEAIAAFQHDNRVRGILDGAPLDIKVMTGIMMTGTTPTFFKIPVTLELADAIERGDYPANPTVVAMHSPEIPRPREGMLHLDNRRSILACFEAFKPFVLGPRMDW